MKKMNAGIVVAGIVTALASSAAQATILANWTFETSVPATAGPHTAENGVFSGISLATGFHASGATVYSNPSGNGSLESFSSNTWAIGDYYQFTTSTVGYQTITFGWDQTASSTGPQLFDLLWSSNGTTWNTLVDDYIVPANTWNTTTPVLGSIFAAVPLPGAADNLATVWVRIVSQQTPASGGTNRVDNVYFTGDAIPAPGALALLGIAGLIGSRRRRVG